MKELEEINLRLNKLESRMDFLFRRLGINEKELPAWNPGPEIIDLVKKGDKMAAIKAFMHETGASLKDAKIFVESIKT